jgi:hypothetical protein
MLGRPRMVDEDSLADSAGPVRMLFHSHAPDRLPKSVLLFANLRGFHIGVSVELTKDGDVAQMGEPSKKDDGDRKDEDKTQTEDQSQSDCHWKRRSGKDKEKVGDTGASGCQWVLHAWRSRWMLPLLLPQRRPWLPHLQLSLSMISTRFTRRS